MKITLKIFFVFLFLALLIVKPTPSYAWHRHSYVGVYIGPSPYYYGDPYYDPYYYRPYYPDPIYVSSPSSSYQPIVINGTTYYLNNGVYYVYTQYGYQAVPTPVGSTAPVAVTSSAGVSADENVFTVNVPNNKGGYTAVILKKSGTGFIGPQGEFYSDFPKVSQLQLMYGK